jgi:hypothetical protein
MKVISRAPNTGQTSRHHINTGLTALLGLSLLSPFISNASEVATNMLLSFNEKADFSQSIDKLLTFDAATANARFFTNRLGMFSDGSMVFTLNAYQGVAIGDPGVATLPSEPRKFFQSNGSATASGGLLTAPILLNTSTIWQCTNTALYCNSDDAFSAIKSSTSTITLLSNTADVLTPIRVQSSISSITPFTENYTLYYGNAHVQGTLQLNALFTTKTTTQYLTDALSATSGTGATNRWSDAASDIKALRHNTYTDVAVSNSLQVSRNAELSEAHRILAVASDAGSLLTIGNTTGTNFQATSELTRQLWNVAAGADPALGRSPASFSSDSFTSTDIATDLAAMRMIVNGADDASFVSGMGLLLNDPLTVGSTPVFSFDGTKLGLTGATMSVFYLGSSNGEVEIELNAASRYALWHSGSDFNNISYIAGASDSLIASNLYNMTEVGRGYGLQYVGESPSPDNLMFLSGNGAAVKLGLNNFYSNKVLVVASWEVTPVPEPSALCMLLFGLVLVGRIKKIA